MVHLEPRLGIRRAAVLGPSSLDMCFLDLSMLQYGFSFLTLHGNE